MDKEKIRAPEEAPEINLSYEQRGLARKIYAMLLEAGCKKEDASELLKTVDVLYAKSSALHKAFHLSWPWCEENTDTGSLQKWLIKSQ